MEIKSTGGRRMISTLPFRARFRPNISYYILGLTYQIYVYLYTYIYIYNVSQLLRKCTHAFIFHRDLTQLLIMKVPSIFSRPLPTLFLFPFSFLLIFLLPSFLFSCRNSCREFVTPTTDESVSCILENA